MSVSSTKRGPPQADGGLSPGIKRAAKEWNPVPEDLRECAVCEESFIAGVDGIDCCAGTEDDVDADTGAVVARGHKPVAWCSKCVAKWFLTERKYPQCEECPDVYPDYAAVRASCPDVRAMPKDKQDEMQQAFDALEHMHTARCPSCGCIGTAHGDGTVEVHNTKPVLCWKEDGTQASQPSMHHPVLCEECLGPLNWCFCKMPKKGYHINHYFRDFSNPKTFLARNCHLTPRDVRNFLVWLMTYRNGRLPAVCPGCRRLVARADTECHELGCCGYKICFLCGYAARGPNLVDHYAGLGGTCTQFPQHLCINGTRYPCTPACQSISGGDCNKPDHKEWRDKYNELRRAEWAIGFVKSLPTKLLGEVRDTLNRIFFPGAPVARFQDGYVLPGAPLSTLGFRKECSPSLLNLARQLIRRAEDLLVL